ncbi:MAG: DoxX family protein [Patescibacteria group bacterium]
MTISILFIVGRIIFGLYWLRQAYNHLFHSAGMIGYAQSKGVPQPKLAVLGTGVLIAIGGLSILSGMWITIGLSAIAIFLVGVTFTMHAYWKDTDPMSKMGNEINFWKNLALLGAVLMMFAFSGSWGVVGQK